MRWQGDLTWRTFIKWCRTRPICRILRRPQEALDLQVKKFRQRGRYGNTGAASVPIALCALLARRRCSLAITSSSSLRGRPHLGLRVVRWADVKALTSNIARKIPNRVFRSRQEGNSLTMPGERLHFGPQRTTRRPR